MPANKTYICLFLITAIELSQQKYALPSNFLFSEYYAPHPGLSGIGPIGGNLDLIVASTVGDIQPTQGIRNRCAPDTIHFFATLPDVGHSGQRGNDMAAILAQLFAVRELNELKHPGWKCC